MLEELKKIVEVKRELEQRLDSLVPISEDRMGEIDRLQMVCNVMLGFVVLMCTALFRFVVMCCVVLCCQCVKCGTLSVQGVDHFTVLYCATLCSHTVLPYGSNSSMVLSV